MIHLDTNTLIRFFVKDDIVKATKVKKLIESGDDIILTDVVFPEIEYVLKNVYHIERKRLLYYFEFLAACPTIKLSDQVRSAVTFFAKTNLDMADCIIAAYSLGDTLASFDRELLNVKGVKGYW